MKQQTSIYQATAENFNQLVIENSYKGPVLVHFWAPWVSPSMMLKPLLAKLSVDYGGRFLLTELNTDEYKTLSSSYGITSMPYLIIFVNGKVVHDLRGGQGEAEFRRILDIYTGRSTNPVHVEAIKLYKEGKVGQAFSLLAQALDNEPASTSIRINYAKLLMAEQQLDQAEQILMQTPDGNGGFNRVTDLLAHVWFLIAARDAPDREATEQAIQADPDNPQLYFNLSAIMLMKDEVAAVMEGLLHMLSINRFYREELARKSIVALFNMRRRP